jgi:2-polyprenyl-6-methoxyphenol hydroxylase-like FAD-dependent oxidoreductase
MSRILREFAQQAQQLLAVLCAPARQFWADHALACLVQRLCDRLPLFGDSSFADAIVAFAGMTRNKAETLQLGDLAADGRVVAARHVRQPHDAQRPAALDAHKQREQRAVQRNTGRRYQRLVALRLVQNELTGFAQDADGVTATVKGSAGAQKIPSKYLVGADGGRSFVRQTLGIDFPGKTLGIRALEADLMLDGLSDDAWHRWNDGTPEQLSLCPLRGTAMFQLQAPIPLEGDFDLSLTGIKAMILKRTGRSDIRVHSVSWASAYNMNARLADQYRVGRIFLAGDAAHIHPPTGGQGLNTSMQDAYNLGWKLAAALDGARDTILESYETERRPVAAEVLGLSTRLLDAAKSSGNMRHGRETQQLDLGYPDSPLSRPCQNDLRTRVSPLNPGDRAPDAPCKGADGQPTRLFELFRGTHWTLLGSHVNRVAARKQLRIHTIGERGDIVDSFGHIREAYGLEQGWVLVRPDGYISAIVPADQTQMLERHLNQALRAVTAPSTRRPSCGPR